jgi:hypothetical protein
VRARVGLVGLAVRFTLLRVAALAAAAGAGLAPAVFFRAVDRLFWRLTDRPAPPPFCARFADRPPPVA